MSLPLHNPAPYRTFVELEHAEGRMYFGDGIARKSKIFSLRLGPFCLKGAFDGPPHLWRDIGGGMFEPQPYYTQIMGEVHIPGLDFQLSVNFQCLQDNLLRWRKNTVAARTELVRE